ncbi:uncharacterized protein LOC108874179 [Lates calcarifer]|uniref:Uncharacterized protein LOC108874179 n=1 Tax=Lates calcarifer TaxID=8187 RepID=A0AAJ7PDC5_LATCA|nr:uncharacterized protein LOC108874179 [Lates calcarifer]
MMMMMMKLTLLLLLLVIFAEVISGIHYVTCLIKSVQGEEGDDVLLQFGLDPSVDLLDHILYVIRADLGEDVVHSYRYGKDDTGPQMSQYRNRTIFIYDPSRRILVRLISAKMSDSGHYGLIIPELTQSCTINVTVVEKDQDNRTNTTIIEPEKRGAEENKRVGAIVGGVLGALIGLALVLILIGVLVKRRKLQIRKKTPNTFELEKLRTRATEGDDHLNRASGNGSGNLLHEVLVGGLRPVP